MRAPEEQARNIVVASRRAHAGLATNVSSIRIFFWREKSNRVTEGRFFSTRATTCDFFESQLCQSKTCAKTICERGGG